jgi:hypothetical protein
MTTGMHLTNRDRAVIAATESFDALKAQLDSALSNGTATPDMLERVNAAAAHVARVSAMPMKFICAHCKGEEHCSESHIILHVAAVTIFDESVIFVGAGGEEVRGAYQTVEYGLDQLRKLPVCAACDDEARFLEHLHEAAIDQESDPRRSMGVAISNLVRMREEALAESQALRSEVERLLLEVSQLVSERRELRLRLSGVAIGGGEQ